MNGSCACSQRHVGEFDLDRLVPLAELVVEGFGGGSVDQLAKILSDMVVLDDLGRRCCTRETARDLFTARAEKLVQDRERRLAERDAARAQGNPLRDRIRALQARETLGDPLADMKQHEIEGDWEKAAEKRAEMANGGMVYHPIREER